MPALGVKCIGGDDDTVEFPGRGARTVHLAVAASVVVTVAVVVVTVVVAVLVGFVVAVALGDLVQQRDEPAELVGLRVDGVLGDDGGFAVDQCGEQVQLVAGGVFGPRGRSSRPGRSPAGRVARSRAARR